MMNINTPMRMVQTVLSLVTIALNAYVSQWYAAHTVASIMPNATVFLLAISALTLLLMPYLYLNPALSVTHHGRTSGRYFNKYAVLAIDGALMVLWFAGFINLAVFQHRLILCGGHVCQVMIGGSVCGAVTCATFLATMVLAVLHVMRTRGGNTTKVAMTNHSQWVGKTDGAA